MPQFSLPSQKQDCINYVDKNEENLVAYFEKPKRSVNQNSLWYGYIGLIADYTGYTPEQTKSIIKQSITDKGIIIMAKRITTQKGVEIIDYKSSDDLKKDEFSLLMNYTMQVCDTMGIQYKYDPIQFATDLFS